MAKAWGTMPKESKFKNRDGLLRSLLKVDEFRIIGENALVRDPDNPKKGRKGRKGRKDLVTSKEILDDQEKKLHKTAILEEDEEEEEEQTTKKKKKK
ncbi:hypothetical protein BASA60_010746 [Batrachochytrium salamandrivorans]|nr:hypothetical protein BASA60_010746 [Batrachochytrium salamandrivorans]